MGDFTIDPVRVTALFRAPMVHVSVPFTCVFEFVTVVVLLLVVCESVAAAAGDVGE